MPCTNGIVLQSQNLAMHTLLWLQSQGRVDAVGKHPCCCLTVVSSDFHGEVYSVQAIRIHWRVNKGANGRLQQQPSAKVVKLDNSYESKGPRARTKAARRTAHGQAAESITRKTQGSWLSYHCAAHRNATLTIRPTQQLQQDGAGTQYMAWATYVFIPKGTNSWQLSSTNRSPLARMKPWYPAAH